MPNKSEKHLLDQKSLQNTSSGLDNYSNMPSDQISKEVENAYSRNSPSENCKANSIETFLGIICVIAGSGIVVLPYAVYKSGLPSIFLLFTNFLVAWYTGTLTIKCLYHDSPRRLMSLPQIGFEAFGIWGRSIVQLAHYGIVLGNVCVYILFAGHNIYITIKDSIESFKLSEKWFILGCGVVILIVYCSAKTIKEAAWMSVVGALATVVVVVVVIVASSRDIHELSSQHKSPIIQWGKLDISYLPSTLATASFAYGGAVVFPHIEYSMKNKKKWSKMLFLALLTVCMMYFIVSFFGNLPYGDKIKEYIYDNFLHTPEKVVSRVFMTSHVLLAAPVYMCSFGIESENYLKITAADLGKKKELVVRIILRTIAMSMLILIAVFVDNIKSIIELIGALANGLIIFIIPVVCYYKLYGFKSMNIQTHLLHAGILALGLICVIFGSLSAIQGIIRN